MILEFILGNLDVVIGFVGALAALFFVNKSVKNAEKLKQKEKDSERAKDIRDRVDNDFGSVRSDYEDRGYRD